MPTTNDNSIVTKGILRYFYGKLDNNVNTLLSLKVDKEDGKGLSTNDFTNAYKNKLDGLSNYSLPIASGSKLGGIKTGYASTGKTYGVQVDADGDAYVNVPWTDTNTTYNVVSNTANGLAPMLPTESADKKFLNGQGQWVVPETGSDINPDDYVKKSGDTMTGNLNMEAEINFGSQKGMSKDQSNRLIIGDTEHHTLIQSSSKVGVYNGKSGAESIVDTGDIVDNLSSTETKKPLSANQGKVLNDKLTTWEVQKVTVEGVTCHFYKNLNYVYVNLSSSIAMAGPHNFENIVPVGYRPNELSYLNVVEITGTNTYGTARFTFYPDKNYIRMFSSTSGQVERCGNLEYLVE